MSSLSLSLMHVQGVLVAAGCYKEAFPVQAVLEHVRNHPSGRLCKKAFSVPQGLRVKFYVLTP